MPDSKPELSTLAALISRQVLDLNLYAAFLLDALAGALPPEYVTVERKRGFLRRKDSSVVRAAVRLRDERFELVRPSDTAVPQARIARESAGIVLKTEVVELGIWSTRLAAALGELAGTNADAAAALARITSYSI